MRRWPARLPWVAGALFVVTSVTWLSRDSRIRHEAFRDYSIYNASAKGLSLAYRYLESTGRAVQVLARPVERAFLPARGVLLRIRPEAIADPAHQSDDKVVGLRPAHAWDVKDSPRYAFTPEEEEWVRGGGRLVIAIDRSYGPIGVEVAGSDLARKVFPVWPGVERIDPPSVRGLRQVPDGVCLFSAGKAPVIVRSGRGAGEIVLCSVPELFQNGHLPRADHLTLLDRLAPTDRPVFFDEYVHGAQGGAGTVEILRQWGFAFLVLIVIAALASRWRRRVRVGPEEDDARETRVEGIDFVDSLALYRRMMPRRHALTLYAKSSSGPSPSRGRAALKAASRAVASRPAWPVRGRIFPCPILRTN
jgi:hypothetical protein